MMPWTKDGKICTNQVWRQRGGQISLVVKDVRINTHDRSESIVYQYLAERPLQSYIYPRGWFEEAFYRV